VKVGDLVRVTPEVFPVQYRAEADETGIVLSFTDFGGKDHREVELFWMGDCSYFSHRDLEIIS